MVMLKSSMIDWMPAVQQVMPNALLKSQFPSPVITKTSPEPTYTEAAQK